MRKIPGNEHFRDRIEYTSIVDYYFGRKAYLAAQVGLNGALQSLNIISVIQSAQVMDNAISAMFGHSCGINISPFALHNANGTMDESTEVVHRVLDWKGSSRIRSALHRCVASLCARLLCPASHTHFGALLFAFLT